ncbi:hypothetical protein [Amycolatopsis rifamycinica]|uniref:Secreted protein n=1 Tax=Amycolatopsis rifamycinica TaxID=287986 RepID=A0A066U079_9PSEU|nr:hypothetical protein [Amycolatopsis rifamycinica]KDN19237.1 hypothetical protein DV20_26655 [Amycolatopsis rifamycinica]
MSLQEKQNRKKQRNRLTRRGLALAGSGAVLATLMSATPAFAANGAGCTSIQSSTGLLCVGWDAQTTKYLNTIRGNFDSPLWGVGNPRIEVRVLDAQNKEMYKKERSWGGNRRSEWAEFEVTVLMPRDASRVCAVLFEGGGYMDMACSPVYT